MLATVPMLRTTVSVMVWPAMAAARATFGLVTIACVMPAGTGLVRNGFGAPRLYSGKPLGVPCGGTLPPTGNGTVLAKANFGAGTVKAMPSAASALPCGIVARRVMLAVSTGA